MATIRKKGNSYFIDYRINGRRIRKSFGSSLEDAQEALIQIEQELSDQKASNIRERNTYSDAVNEFRKYINLRLARSSQQRYYSILENFTRFLKTNHQDIKQIVQISSKVIEEFKASRLDEGITEQTINSELIVIRKFMRLAIQWGYILVDPTQNVQKFVITPKKNVDFLSKENCKTLLDITEGVEWLIIYTILNTGLKKNEIRNLRWEDINFHKREIRIINRKVPISDALNDLLSQQMYECMGSDFIFVDKKGKKFTESSFYKIFQRIIKKGNLNPTTTFQTLRHSFAAQAIMNGMDLLTLKEIMGYSMANAVLIYNQLTKRNASDLINSITYIDNDK